jgi:CBS domain-containing protein
MLRAMKLMMMHGRVALDRTTTLKGCAYRLISTGYPGLPVVDRDMKVVGIVTEFDLLGALREGFDLDTTAAERIMSKEPRVAGVEASTDELIEMMLENNLTVVPIVKNGKLVGVVSRSEIMSSFVEPGCYRPAAD